MIIGAILAVAGLALTALGYPVAVRRPTPAGAVAAVGVVVGVSLVICGVVLIASPTFFER